MKNLWRITSIISLLATSLCAQAKDLPEFQITLQNHLFYPSSITILPNQKVKLLITNKDASHEQFESFDLNREKVIFSGKTAVIYIGPLSSGEYEFYGEFHPDSAQGKIIVKPLTKVSSTGASHADQ